MIVDMVRNDLGRVCRAGSVHVPTLFAVEPYRTVWQMTSTVTGEVRRDATLAEIMAAIFPGASITGAPKHHTMEIIAELETEPRGVYTGTVALFLPGGDFTCNIAIRTIVHERGSYPAGRRGGHRLGLRSRGGVRGDADQGGLRPAAGREPVGDRCPLAERVRAASIGLFETLLLEAAAGRRGRREPGQDLAERGPRRPAGRRRCAPLPLPRRASRPDGAVSARHCSCPSTGRR